MLSEAKHFGSFLAQAAAPPVSPYGNTNLELVLGMMLFIAAGFGMVFAGLLIGKIARPTQPHPEKVTPYECGEEAVGESWVQFDLRFYTVALVFIVFDVEIALLWPWAVTFKQMGAPAFWAFFVFFMLIAIPFLYEWKSGYLNWVRSHSAQSKAAGEIRTVSRSVSPESASNRSSRARAAASVE